MERKTHELSQGSIQWHQFRANHHGASEASAMLGISPYKSRTELLREKKTGIAPDVDAATQRIFDRGHEVEALARPLAESVIGEDLFPVVMSFGNLSASCDGLTFDESIAWECKSSNKADLETVKIGELPEKHWPQVQQVMYVTGAEKLLFTISDGTEEGTAHVWVASDTDLQARIIAGWERFEKDLEDYQPEPEVIPAKAEPVMALPALSMQVGGAISIQSNLDIFGERLKSFIEETNAKPETDQDFANLEQACKVLKDAEDALKRAEGDALAQTASVDEMRRTVAYLSDMARNNRLTFEKLLKSEKENRKAQIVFSAKSELNDYMNVIQSELPKVIVFGINQPNFADAIKGKKTLSSMQDAVNTMLANAKIEADALARELREKHTWYIENASEYSFLFSDLSGLIYKPADDFKAVAENRIAQHKEQERIKAEQQAKEQAEREARIAAEAAEKARREEQQRIAAEQAKADQEYRERLERENQQELEHASQKANDKTGIDNKNDDNIELQTSSSPVSEDKLLQDDNVPAEFKQSHREKIIRMTVSYFYSVSGEAWDLIDAEQWLIEEFGSEN